MIVDVLGERALILRGLPGPPFRCAADVLRRLQPVPDDVVPSYETLGLFFPTAEAAREAAVTLAEFDPAVEPAHAAMVHEVPVRYDGEDLAEVVERLGITREEFVVAHTGTVYECAALGFCPGFAYLGSLPEALAGVPRRPRPRPRVAAGSVAITGSQTAVYPLDRPGGWALVGRTPLVMVDVADRWFPIRAGDLVRFREIGSAEFDALSGRRLG